MARTTAEIDGDSSGLVGALDRGKAAMSRMATEGTKLSDQLREVTDDADRVAGALIEKIGGPTAIKAIAGVGVAMGAVKMGTEAFLGSAEALFRSFGDEGQKVWDQTEKGLFAIKGAFAEAVLGGGSVEEMGQRLATIFDGVKVALQAVLLPLRLVSEGIWGIARATDGLTLAETKALENETKYREALDGTLKSIRDQKTAYDELGKTLGDVVISKQEAARQEYETTLAAIDAQLATNDENRAFRANAAADLAAAKAAEALFASSLASTRAKAEHELTVINDGVKQSQFDIDARAREMLLEDSRFRAQLMISQNSARADAIAANSGMTQYEIDAQNELLRRRENYVQKAEELNWRLWNPEKPAKTSTGGGGGGKAGEEGPADKLMALMQRLNQKATAATAELEAQMDEAERTVAEGAKKFLSSLFEPEPTLLDSWKEVTEGMKTLYGDVVAVFTRGNEKMSESTEVTLTKEQEARRAQYDQWVNQNAKMVATELVNGKKMSDLARAMVGNVITALGDKAMTEAGLAFAVGNVGTAAALTAAGAAAYATAAYLGSTAKKSGSATKATADKPSTVTTNNTNFNLRVDAAFADEEGIARAFAKAQRLASTRYLGASSY